MELIGPKEGTITLCADEAILLAYRSKTRVVGEEILELVG